MTSSTPVAAGDVTMVGNRPAGAQTASGRHSRDIRSLAEQNEAGLGGPDSILARQKRDHVELDELLQRLETALPAEQDAVLRSIYRLTFTHAFAEESVLWPLLRRILPDGEALTLRVEREHQQINELVLRLDQLAPGSTERQQLLDQAIGLMRQDVRDEEDELLARLQARTSDAQLRLIGLAWSAVRRIAPTRAHPIVSRRPPGNVLAALPLSVLDRSRDIIDAAIQQRRATAIIPACVC